MTLSEAYPSKYLKASDMPEDGSGQTFTIERVTMEEIGKEKDSKPVVYFDENHKGLVLNKTNARTIAKVLDSEDLDEWQGKTISLYRAEVEYQGEMTEAIRVKIKAPAKAKGAKSVPMSQPSSDRPYEEEIPF